MELKRLAATAVLPVMLTLAAGCTAPTASLPAGGGEATAAGCPTAGWDAAILWSSESAAQSSLTYVKGSEVVGRQRLPFQGLEASPTDGIVRRGEDVWIKSNGNAQRDRTNVLRLSTRTCQVRAYPVEEPLLLALAAHTDGFSTTNTLNGAAEVRRRDLEGRLLAEARFPGLSLTALVEHGDSILALGSTMGTERDEGVMLQLDAATLRETRRTTLPGVSEGPQYAVLRDGALYYPRTIVAEGDSAAEGSQVGRIELASGAERTLDTGAPAPYLLEASGGSLYAGHTFMNSGFRPTDDYRTVTRLTDGAEPASIETAPGLLDMSVDGDRLLTLTSASDAAPRVTTYALPSLTEASFVEVPAPSGPDHGYLAGLITPAR